MKKVLRVAAAALAAAIPLYAAMSDPSALKKAKATWGDVAVIGQKRNMVQSNWSKLVGYASPKCVEEFTVVGNGFNTWDAAFADADMHPATVGGPFKGTITVQVNAWDNVALTNVQFYIDGNAIAMAKTPDPPVQMLAATWDIDTTMLTNGYHVLCSQGTDASGLVGKTYNGHLFKVDQAAGVNGTASLFIWFPGSETDGRPGLGFPMPPLIQR